MKVIEVRDSFIKFEEDETLENAGFVKVIGFEKSYLAQILQRKRIGAKTIDYAKVIFSYENDKILDYDGSFPSNNDEIVKFPIEEIIALIKTEKPIIVGKSCENENSILVDMSQLNKLIVSAETRNFKTTVIENLSKQIMHKSKLLVIDMTGEFKGKSYKIGTDFKLPVNTETLDFIYNDCLSDATSDCKDIVKDIFKDLSEYSKTVKYLPFGMLKTVVDDMVDHSHIFKLLVLKNKLARFAKLGYFATDKKEADSLNKIFEKNAAVINLHGVEPVFQNRIIESIYVYLENQSIKTEILLNVSDNVSKKALKTIILNDKINSVFVTDSSFKYINDIKRFFKNFIIEPGTKNNQIFNTYSAFLKAMKPDTYLIAGDLTNQIPLISKLLSYDDVVNTEVEEASEEDIKSVYIPEPDQPDEQTEAIDKKSDELIDRISEEVCNEPAELNSSLFETEDSDQEFAEAGEVEPFEPDSAEQYIEKSEPEEIEYKEEVSSDDNVDIEVSDEDEIHSPMTEFHTNVDNTPSEAFENIYENSLNIESDETETEETGVIPEISQEDEIVEIPADIDIEYSDNVNSDETGDSDSSEELDIKESYESIVVNDDYENNLDNYNSDISINQNDAPVSDVIPLSDNLNGVDEIVELDESEFSEADILIDIDSDKVGSDENAELNQEIIDDVDKVYTTIKEDDLITDSDLDLIDELNDETNAEINNDLESAADDDMELAQAMDEELYGSSEYQELQEYQEEISTDDYMQPLQEINDTEDIKEQKEDKEILMTKNSSTPIVPVYDAEIPQEDLVVSDNVEQGDSVVHAKYGVGVVEKMIKYGTKTLYSINFDNVGRRLLDPTLTEIKKA